METSARPDPSTVLKIERLCRDFAAGDEVVHALRDVSFEVRRGEYVTIMGPSGSGKSTLLSLLGCLDAPTSGRYWIDGEEVGRMDPDRLAAVRNRRIGFVFQSFNLLSRVSALENVELPLYYNRSIPARRRREMAKAALDAVGLSHRASHRPNQLSGGQQQRVAIARALVGEPALLLADEATGNLDSRTSLEILALFRRLEEQGKTIVFVTHSPDVARYSARTIRLLDGRLQEDAPVADRAFVEEIP